MRLKKGIISVSTVVVVILGVFFALRFVGGRESATNIKPDNSIVESNNGVIATDSKQSDLNSQSEQQIENTQSQSTNVMDVAYVNDKTNVGIYTVKKNDTVFSIVKTYMPNHNKSEVLEFIKTRNNINQSYKISEGQKIVIPYEKAIETSNAVDADVSTSQYTIKKQDTLTSIAKINMPAYNVKQAIEMLKEANKITEENDIKEGTHIYIPK